MTAIDTHVELAEGGLRQSPPAADLPIDLYGEQKYAGVNSTQSYSLLKPMKYSFVTDVNFKNHRAYGYFCDLCFDVLSTEWRKCLMVESNFSFK